MNGSQSFSALNERLRPRFNTTEKLYSSLNRLDDKQLGSLRSKPPSSRPMATVLPTQPQPKVSVTVTEPEEDSEKPEEDLKLEDEGNICDLLPFNNMCLLSELNLKDMGEEPVDDDSSCISPSEEKDIPGELTSAETLASTGEGESSIQGNYIDGSLPDLIRSGRPLGRRRTVGHVSATLKEVRREVELSRRRSIKIKAQVDKLQETREGPGWSQHREKVTEEVLSILGLLQPLTAYSPPESTHGDRNLDTALAQLQNVARTLAISHTTQKGKSGANADDSAILQQALHDRDDAVEKKKAMEAELLRSKMEMMNLNNQLLEAVQKRLELSLELEAWKDDVQLILQHQLQQQQQAEQAQKKPSRLGILKRNRPTVQRLPNLPSQTPAPPTTNTNQIFVSKSAVSATPTPSTSPSPQRNWRDKLRSRMTSRQPEQDPESEKTDDNFQVISLD